jgi:crossover junction endodeoxyribonuclease RuvC
MLGRWSVAVTLQRSTLVAGIDPGLDGALALIEAATLEVFEVLDFPTVGTAKREPDEAALFATLARWRTMGCTFVVYETQQAFPKQGRSSCFSLGVTFGVVRAAIAAAGIAREPVSPRTWKRDAGLTSDKADSRAAALRLFPGASDMLGRKRDEGRAESLLLAAYAAKRWRAA